MYYLNAMCLVQEVLQGFAEVIFILLQKLMLVQLFSYEDTCDNRLKFLLKHVFPLLCLREILFSLLRNMTLQLCLCSWQKDFGSLNFF